MPKSRAPFRRGLPDASRSVAGGNGSAPQLNRLERAVRPQAVVRGQRADRSIPARCSASTSSRNVYAASVQAARSSSSVASVAHCGHQRRHFAHVDVAVPFVRRPFSSLRIHRARRVPVDVVVHLDTHRDPRASNRIWCRRWGSKSKGKSFYFSLLRFPHPPFTHTPSHIVPLAGPPAMTGRHRRAVRRRSRFSSTGPPDDPRRHATVVVMPKRGFPWVRLLRNARLFRVDLVIQQELAVDRDIGPAVASRTARSMAARRLRNVTISRAFSMGSIGTTSHSRARPPTPLTGVTGSVSRTSTPPSPLPLRSRRTVQGSTERP